MSEPEFCADETCTRRVLPPHIYCDKHKDASSTPVEPQHAHTWIVSEWVTNNEDSQHGVWTHALKLLCPTCLEEKPV